MVLREFGSTGVQVPLIGQGTWKMTHEVDALRTGIELGMVHLDTAEMYGEGKSETLIAMAALGVPRQRLFVVSKVLPKNASYAGTIEACERSLRYLQMDYLDVYLLHWWSNRHPIEETMSAMEELVQQGKIRFIGVSNLDRDHLMLAQNALTRNRIVCNQVLYHLRSRGIEHELLPYCEQHRIAVVGYSPFGQGDFPSRISKQGRVLRDIGLKHEKTPRQVALNFLTRRPSLFAIPKAGSLKHVRENAGGAGWSLDNDDLRAIDKAFPLPPPDSELDMA